MDMQHRLFELRQSRNLTQQRLAIDLGIDQTSISSYECGKYLPTVEVLVKIAEYFGVSTDYLLGLSEIKSPLKTAQNEKDTYFLSLFRTLPGVYQERAIGYLEALNDVALCS